MDDNARQIVTSVRRRLAWIRAVNALLLLLAPILAVALVLLCLWLNTIPLWAGGLCVLLSLTAGVFLIGWHRTLFRQVRTEEAAAVIDRETHGQERFLTIATLEPKPQAVRVIEEQCRLLLAHFSAHSAVPIRVERAARYSTFASPVFVLAILAVLGFRSSVENLALSREEQLALEHVRVIEGIVAGNSDLPKNVRTELSQLAALVEENRLLNPAVLDQTNVVSELIDEVEERTGERTVAREEEKTSTHPKPESPSEPDRSSEGDDATPEEKMTPEETRERDTKEGRTAGEKQRSSQPESRDDGGQGKKVEEDEKKNVTGVGEGGKGGRASTKPMSEGEKQPGSDGRGAQAGPAEHGTKAETGTPPKQESAPDQGKEGERKQDKRQQKPSEQEGDGAKGGIQQAKQAVAALKAEIERQSPQPLQPQESKSGGDSSAPKSEGKGKEGSTGKKIGEKGETPPEGGEKSKSARPQKRGEKPGGGEQEGATNSQREGEEPEGHSRPGDDRSQKPLERPTPGAKERAFGEGEGEIGPLPGEEHVRVNIPKEEKILVRSAGPEDPRRYSNPNQDRSRTALGTEEFVKPEAESSRITQPIPVEYGDMLR